jgi:hypothetical protein
MAARWQCQAQIAPRAFLQFVGRTLSRAYGNVFGITEARNTNIYGRVPCRSVIEMSAGCKHLWMQSSGASL